MLGEQATGAIDGVLIHTVSHEPPKATYKGKPVQLAIITEDGQVIASGTSVAQEIEAAIVTCYRNTLKGFGHLRVQSSPIPPLLKAA
ncbi:hypothetical protein [Comamonas thiooxydans]|uniref:hypothetical protein n=1 Tax=Comamonas thiooxydans TaxID=363952 RepID=UPI00209C069B|nr:hypothetical protein [Comamonas thiooxydans]MCO8250164.1 hypothetical protein [Comamonas thiooxydans]